MAVLLSTAGVNGPLYAQAPPANGPQKVLLLNSYHKGYLWTDEITRGIEETLASNNIELHIEYMDTKRQYDIPYQNLLRQVLHYKHRRHQYDVIISSDNNAFDFLKNWGEQIFGKVPVVFCGVNYLQKEDVEGLDNYTGVNEKMNILGNLSLIKKLHPQQKKVIIITDNTTTGKENQKEVRRIIAQTDPANQKIDLIFDVSIDELRQTMQGLDEETVVLFTIFIRDKNDIFLGYDQGMKLVCDNTSAPIYATQNFKPGLPVIGGYLTSGYDQGAVAASKAVDLLTGKPVSEVPIQWDTPTRPRFDYRNLKRQKISFNHLPPGSEILHQPVSFYYQHKTLIWNTVVAFGMLLLAFCGVFYGLILSRQAAAKLLRNEENLRTTLDSIGDAVIATDTEGKIVRMNPVAEQLTGWRLQDALGRPLPEVFHIINGDTHMPVPSPAEKVLGKGKIIGLANHTVLISKDGSEHQIADSGAPIRDQDGRIVGVVLVFRDVTESYAQAKQIKDNEQRYRNLFDKAPVMYIITENREGEPYIIDVNDMFIQELGYSRQDVINTSLRRYYSESSMESLDKGGYQRALDGKFIPEERIFVARDGRLVHTLLHAEPHVDSKNRVVGTRTMYTNITARKQAEKQAKKLETALIQSQKLEAVGTLAGGVAHDFNNLLMGIQGRISILADDPGRTDVHMEHFSAIENYIRGATELTKQLLGFTRGGKYEVKPTDINVLVQNGITMFGRTKKEIIISTSLHDPPPVVDGDRRQIEQVLLNLYVNAWQAMPQGGKLTVQTQIVNLDEAFCEPYQVAPGRYAKISVTDTGIGMDASILQQIFDPFFTTKEKSRGTGLGLASAYGIIKNHDGMITVYSERDRGTTLNIYLPESDKPAVQELAPSAKEITKGTETVLLVDDEEMIIDVGQAMLVKLGYRVLTAQNGEQAVEMVKKQGNQIDLVILDLIMPGIKGGKAFDLIRDIQPEMPVLLSSGYAINGQATQIMDRGCNGFIQKPFSLSELSQKIRQILDDAGA